MLLHNLANNLRKHGLTVVETEGWQNRGYLGQDLYEVRGVLHHHTATPRSNYNYSDSPTLSMCVNGRSDLPGPLCQIVLGRSGTVYIVAAGLANHAGSGYAAGIPAHTGNYYFIGIEYESSGIAPWDWTEDQKRVAPYLGAALELEYLQHLPEDMRIQLGHKEYSDGGKIDPAGWPGDMDGLRAQINDKIAELRGGTKPAAPNVSAPVPNPDTTKGPFVPDPHWTVEKDETLTDVADWAGFSVQEVADFNGIKDINRITVGERIWSPAGRHDTWVVDPGDTLSKVSQWYADQGYTVSVQQLQFANGINNPSTDTKVGMRLIVP